MNAIETCIERCKEQKRELLREYDRECSEIKKFALLRAVNELDLLIWELGFERANYAA